MQLHFESDGEDHNADIDAARCLDASRDAAIALDAAGRVVVWSAGAERMYGWSSAEVIGGPLPWPTGDGRAIEHRQLHDLARQGVVMGAVEVVTPRRNGSETVVEVSADPVRDETGRIVGTCAIHRDVAARSPGRGIDIDLTVDDVASEPPLGFDAFCREYRLDALERDLVALLLTGNRIPEMARAVHRSQGTVRNRMSALYRKVGVHGQIELLDQLRLCLGRVAPVASRDAPLGTAGSSPRVTDESDLGPYGRDAWAGHGDHGGRVIVA